MNKILLSIIFSIYILPIWSQTGHQINIQINDYEGKMLLLTSYYGEKIYLVDSAFKNQKGVFEFKGEKDLPAGMYMAVSSDKDKLFEFLVDDTQFFNLYTDTTNYVLQMKTNGSPENKLFFDFVKHNSNLRRQEKELIEQQKSFGDTSPYYKVMQNEIDSVKKLSEDFTLETIESMPGSLVSVLLNAMRENKIPDSIQQTNDRGLIFTYFRNHYWDNFDLSDARLLRTPLLTERINQYFSSVVVFHPDSVVKHIDTLIDKARPSGEMVSWLVWHFISKYQNPDYMGFDKVFVHMVDEYISKEEINNSTPSIVESLQTRAEQIRPLLLGEPAPNLILIDTTGAYYSFQSLVNEYTILFFWDYDCGICTGEIYHLQQTEKNSEFDIGIYAISTNGDLDKWKQEIQERKIEWVNVNGTRSVTADFRDLYDIQGAPALFILDKDKNIIAKNIAAEKVETFLTNYSKMNEAQKLNNSNE